MTKWTTVFPNYDLGLRTEFNGLVLGSTGEEPIAQPFILRRMRRDSDNELIRCYCMDEIFNEPTRDYPCTSCYGAGYLFDEEIVWGYKIIGSPPGSSNADVNYPKLEGGTTYLPSIRFFFPYDIAPTKEDRIVELELSESGCVITPYNRVAIYEITLLRALRAERGRIVYWGCHTQKMGPKTKGGVS